MPDTYALALRPTRSLFADIFIMDRIKRLARAIVTHARPTEDDRKHHLWPDTPFTYVPPPNDEDWIEIMAHFDDVYEPLLDGALRAEGKYFTYHSYYLRRPRRRAALCKSYDPYEGYEICMMVDTRPRDEDVIKYRRRVICDCARPPPGHRGFYVNATCTMPCYEGPFIRVWRMY